MRLTLVVWAALLAACPRPQAPKPKEELRIGAVLPLTGPEAAYGVACRSGLELAIAEANREARPGEPRLRAIFSDDHGSAEEAVWLAQRLVTKDRVDLLIGEVSSRGATAIAEVADRAKTPMISPAATAPGLTERSPFVFRIAFTDPFQARAMARFARRDLGREEVAIVRDLSSEYSIVLAEAFRAAFTESGGKVILDEGFDRADTSIFPLAEKLVDAKVALVYLPGYVEEVGRIVGAIGSLGHRPIYLGSDGWDTAEIMAQGALLEGSYFTTHYSPDDPRKETQAFVRAFTETYNEAPDAIAALGYDTIRFALAAIARGGTDRLRLQRALAQPIPFVGVTGEVLLDERRNVTKPAVVLRIEKSAKKFVTRLAPDERPRGAE